MQNVEQRFYRSGNRIFGGVCAGLAEGLHIDPLWVRVAFVILGFLQGVGFFIYIVLWLVMPERVEGGGQRSGFDAMSADLKRIWSEIQQQTRGTGQPAGTTTAPPSAASSASSGPTQPVGAPPAVNHAPGSAWHNQGVVLGVILVVVGLAILGSNVGIINWSVVWPAALITLGIVVLYRVGATLPSPGVNYPNVQKCIAQVSGGEAAQIYSLINLFSGGALLQLTVFAVGVMPYITASIIVQLLTVVIPRFEELRKEGQSGQVKMTQYTRYLAIALAILQATSIVALAANGGLLQGCTLEIIQGQSHGEGLNIFTLVVIVLVMTAGAALVMWMGELVTERGIARELDSLRDRMRREALRRRWPQERIEQLLHRRDELRELGVLEGLEREVAVRAGVIWTSLQGKRDALDLFAKKLRLTREDALRLQKLLHLS